MEKSLTSDITRNYRFVAANRPSIGECRSSIGFAAAAPESAQAPPELVIAASCGGSGGGGCVISHAVSMDPLFNLMSTGCFRIPGKAPPQNGNLTLNALCIFD